MMQKTRNSEKHEIKLYCTCGQLPSLFKYSPKKLNTPPALVYMHILTAGRAKEVNPQLQIVVEIVDQ